MTPYRSSSSAPFANLSVVVFGVIGVLATLGVTSALAQSVALTHVGVVPGPVEHVRVQGDRLYISHHVNFTIWDVSDPSAPLRRGSIEMPEEIWGFRIRGERAYIGANFFGVAIVDISNPETPQLLGNHKTLGQAKIGAIYGNRVALIDHMEGLVMVDVSDETTPTGAGAFFLDGYARDVVTSGNIAYATDSPTGLYVFDLSHPGEPDPIGILHSPASPRFIEVQREVGEPSGILAGAGGGHLQVYDATNPTTPVKAATFETPGRAARVAMSGNYVFIADTEAGIHIVDISSPSRPLSAGMFSTNAPTRDIAATETFVYAVVGAGERQEGHTEVQILRRSE